MATNVVRFPEYGAEVKYSANSEFNANYTADKAANGNIDTTSGAGGISWAQSSSGVNGWWQCEWSCAQVIDRVKIYDRGPTDGTTFGTAGNLTFSDGSQVNWSGLTDGGSLTIDFSPRLVSWFRVTATTGASGFAGLAEVESSSESGTNAVGRDSVGLGNTGTATAAVPPGDSGDLLIFQVACKGPSIAQPSGWNLIANDTANTGGFDTIRMASFWRTADGTETSVSATLSPSAKWAAGVTRFPESYIILGSSSNSINSSTNTATASAFSTGGVVLLLLTASNAGNLPFQWTPTSGWNERRDTSTTGGLTVTNASMGAFTKSHPGGSTGTPSATEVNSDAKIAQLISLGFSKPTVTMVIV